MKKLFVLLSAIGAFSFIPLTTAEAGTPYRLTGYTPCGQPIYAYFHIHGYNSCGQPVGHWITQYPSSCGCNSAPICKPTTPVIDPGFGQPGHQHGHNHGHGHNHNHGGGSGGTVIIEGSGAGWGFKVVK